MRITEVMTLKLRFSMTTPMADAIHYMPERNLLLVQVATDDGLVGLGECAAYGGSLDSMERVVLDDLAPSLVGEDPFHVERLWSRMARRSHQRGTTGMLMQAISGVDIALWDLIGQATKTPLYRLLGGYRDTLEAYASAGFYAGGKGLTELAEEVPEGDVNPADGLHQRAGGASLMGTARHAAPEPLDLKGVFADQRRLQVAENDALHALQ